MDFPVVVTDAAAAKAAQMAAEAGAQDCALRVTVGPGGCAGLRYQLNLDRAVDASDLVHDTGAIRVVLDPVSAGYLQGATVDYVERFDLQGFTVDNPSWVGTCGCGSSFC